LGGRHCGAQLQPLQHDAVEAEVLTFTADARGTLLAVRHGPFANQPDCDRHVVGWTDTFERVAVWRRRVRSLPADQR
jgi:hypothetical protein